MQQEPALGCIDFLWAEVLLSTPAGEKLSDNPDRQLLKRRPRTGVDEKDQDASADDQRQIEEEGAGLAFERAVRAEAPGRSSQPLLGGECLFHIRLQTAAITFHEDLSYGADFTAIIMG